MKRLIRTLIVWLLAAFAGSLCVPQAAHAQTPPTCTFSTTATMPGAGSAFDNRFHLCQNYDMMLIQSGSTSFFIQMEGAPDSGGSAGTWSLLTPFSGLNPSTKPPQQGTATRQAQINLSAPGNATHSDWLRFNVIAIAGTMQTVTITGQAPAVVPSTPGPNAPRPLVTYTYSATPVFNVALGDTTMTLTGNITKWWLNGLSKGLLFNVTFCNDAVGSRTISGTPSFLTGFTWSTTTASACTTQEFYSVDGLTAAIVTGAGGGSGGCPTGSAGTIQSTTGTVCAVSNLTVDSDNTTSASSTVYLPPSNAVTFVSGGTTTVDWSVSNFNTITGSGTTGTTVAFSNIQTNHAGVYILKITNPATALVWSMPNTSICAPSSANESTTQFIAYDAGASAYVGSGCRSSILGVISGPETAFPLSTSGNGKGYWDSTGHVWCASDNAVSTPNCAVPSGVQNDIICYNSAGYPIDCGILTTVIPQKVKSIDLVTQSAAQTTVSLFTPTATGMYRVTYYSKVTQAATTSSVLAGSTGFVIAYTDGTDSVAVTPTMASFVQTGGIMSTGTGNPTNTTQASAYGIGMYYMKTGVAVTFSFGYTSVGATPMQYEIHVRVEGAGIN